MLYIPDSHCVLSACLTGVAVAELRNLDTAKWLSLVAVDVLGLITAEWLGLAIYWLVL